MMAIIIGVLLFMFLVLIHEAGHFIAAKKSGVKVLEFGIGIPPRLFRFYKDKDGTEYTLNLIPLGGFVRLKGESANDEDFLAKDSFITAKLWKKLIILFAGVTMNLVFAWLFFVMAFWKGIKPLQVLPSNVFGTESQSYIIPSYSFLKASGFISGENKPIPVTVEEVISGTIAEKIGILKDDKILEISGQKVNTLNLADALKNQIGKTFSIKIQRQQDIFEKTLECPQDSCLLGIYMKSESNEQILPIKFGFLGAMVAGFHEIVAQTKLTLWALGSLGKNLISFEKEKIKSSVQKMSGPVGAVKVGQIILDNFGFWMYLAFAGMISLALAIFNVLPLPALDGGRAVSVFIQALFKLKPQMYFTVENYINIVMFMIFLTLGIYVIFLDLQRFWGVNVPGM